MATIWFLVQLFQGFKESLGTLMSSIFDKKVMVLRLKFYYWRCLAKQIAYSNCEVQNRYWRLLLFRKLTDRPKFFRFVRLLVQTRYNEVFLKSMKTTLKTWKTKVEVIIEFHKTMSDNSREKYEMVNCWRWTSHLHDSKECPMKKCTKKMTFQLHIQLYRGKNIENANTAAQKSRLWGCFAIRTRCPHPTLTYRRKNLRKVQLQHFRSSKSQSNSTAETGVKSACHSEVSKI